MDGPHKGSKFMSTKWTDPTRVNYLTKSTKWMDHTRDQNSCPQSKQTPTRVDGLTKSTKWTDPMRDQYSVHKVDGPH